MYQLTEFNTKDQLDVELADKIAKILAEAIDRKGTARIAVSGGSTPKGLFKILSNKEVEWSKVFITLADERWVEQSSDASNTSLVLQNLLQHNAKEASFFHLKKEGDLTEAVLNDLNASAKKDLLPLDVLILGMGEDGHTASLFPCSEQIQSGLSVDNKQALMMVEPKTAPHLRISFTFSALAQSENVFLHLCGDAKKSVLNKALGNNDVFEMPIRAFLQNEKINTQVYWAA